MMKTSLHAYTSQLQTKADAPGPYQRFAKTMLQSFLDVSDKLSGSWISSGVSQKTYIYRSGVDCNGWTNKD